MLCISADERGTNVDLQYRLRNVDLALLHLLINDLMSLFYVKLCLHVCALPFFKLTHQWRRLRLPRIKYVENVFLSKWAALLIKPFRVTVPPLSIYALTSIHLQSIHKCI